VGHGASDVLFLAGKQPIMKVHGRMINLSDEPLTPKAVEEHIKEIYVLANQRDFSRLRKGDDDFAIGVRGVGRFRVNAYQQQVSLAAVLRVIPSEIPNPVHFGIPPGIMELADHTRGLILFTGVTGSGKTTSLACLIDKINSTRDGHIVTIEDPIEFKHPHKMGAVSHRELGIDSVSYASALKSALRQTPDVILLGEMRDLETMATAITAAETGHLVFSTLHTRGAAATLERIIDVFPVNQQAQVRVQLSVSLQAIVAQQLLPTQDSKRIAAYEIMLMNPAIRNLIREGKVYQIDNVIQTSAASGMRTMDDDILDLYRQHKISREIAMRYSFNPGEMLNKL